VFLIIHLKICYYIPILLFLYIFGVISIHFWFLKKKSTAQITATTQKKDRLCSNKFIFLTDLCFRKFQHLAMSNTVF
jgi:hypothetical protein